jgi:hypothetical protein
MLLGGDMLATDVRPLFYYSTENAFLINFIGRCRYLFFFARVNTKLGSRGSINS